MIKFYYSYSNNIQIIFKIMARFVAMNALSNTIRLSHQNSSSSNDNNDKKKSSDIHHHKPVGISNSYLTGHFYTNYLHPITKKAIDDLDIEEDDNDMVRTYLFVDKCKDMILKFNNNASRIKSNSKEDIETGIDSCYLEDMQRCLRPTTRMIKWSPTYKISNEAKKYLLDRTEMLYHKDDKIDDFLENKCKNLIIDFDKNEEEQADTNSKLNKIKNIVRSKKCEKDNACLIEKTDKEILEKNSDDLFTRRNHIRSELFKCMRKSDFSSLWTENKNS